MQVYASLLSGFLIAASPKVKEGMISQMADGSVQPIVEGVQKCLEFYASTGTITDRTEKSLREVLLKLTES